MDIKKWPVLKSDWLYSLQPKMEKLHTVSKNKTGSRLWLKSWTPYDSKFTLKLKKVGETTRLFRYDLNQISCDYVVKVTNRFKGLDLIDTVPEELWMEVCNTIGRWWSKPSPRKRNVKRQNGCLRRTLQIAEKRREVKVKGEKERYIPIWMQSSKG